MKISFSSKGGFDNTERWLNDIARNDMTSSLNHISNQGVQRLSAGTPVDTGETANGWKGDVTTKGDISEVVWTNTAHPGARVNIAKLIELGHGTGTGGYVPPRPYIKNSMKPVWSSVDDFVKELIK